MAGDRRFWRSKHPSLPARILVYLVALILIVCLSGLWYFNYLQSPVGPRGGETSFVVVGGESVGKIADRLESQGLIRSSLVFRILLKLSGNSSKIRTGGFSLSSAMTTMQVIDALSQNSPDQAITLLEGWRVAEMADKLHERLGIKSEEFLRVAQEGYMFPDTYRFGRTASAAAIAQVMRANFDKKYSRQLQEKIRQQGLTPEQGVILASIVEREARTDEVRRMVAGILLKRLKMGMPLQADATVRYAKDSLELKSGKAVGKFWQPITQEDYASVNSPYNTYLYPGLPPGPISNPSLSSLEAVGSADPSTPYLYYYHDSQGNTYYSTTLEEHNRNVASHP